MDDLPPPWVAVPGLTADEPANQGLAETYIDLNWLPFWQSLSADAKAQYLDHWAASPEWREAIALRYDQTHFDIEADAREAREWADARQASADKKHSLWNQIGKGGRR